MFNAASVYMLLGAWKHPPNQNNQTQHLYAWYSQYISDA